MTPLCASRALLVQFSAERGGSPISGLAVVERLQQRGLSVHAVFGGDGPMRSVYADRGCRVGRVDHGAWLGGGSLPRKVLRVREELASVLRFRRLIRDLDAKLVYVNTMMGLAAILAARLERVPCVWHLRELLGTSDSELRDPVIGPRAARRALHLATRTVCISGAVAEAAGLEVDGERVRLIANPLETQWFERNSGTEVLLSGPGKTLIVGVPGTLRPVKGHEVLLRALPALCDLDIRVIVSGSGADAYEAYLRALAVELGVSDRVEWLGDLDDMIPFYDRADVLCVPSRSEPFGRTVVEAFARRKPVIASDTGGIRESISHGQSGLLFPVDDSAELAAALRRLAADAGLRSKLADQGFRIAEQRHHVAHVAAQLDAVLLPLLEGAA